MDKKIGKEVRYLSTKIGRKIHSLDSLVCLENLSGTNGFIIHYLENNQDKHIYQKDIEKNFGITRSTASKILSLMEDKGLIERTGCACDGRLKEIRLTPMGFDFAKKIGNDLKNFDETLTSCLTEDELKEFFKIIDKLNNKLEEM